MTFQELQTKFVVKYRGENHAQCICPAHDDDKASLRITDVGNKTLVHCYAGCKTEAILDSVGLTMRDLYSDDNYSNLDRWKKYIEKRTDKTFVAEYSYHDLSGKYAFSRIRLEPKEFIIGLLSDGIFHFGLGDRGPNKPPAVYTVDFDKFRGAVQNGDHIYYVEGEKDVQTLAQKGYIGITCGSASDWKDECKSLFIGADVVILADNDKVGRESSNKVMAALKEVAKSVSIVIPTPDREKGDISDYFENHTAEEFEALIREHSTHEVVECPWDRPIPFDKVEPMSFPVDALPLQVREYVKAVAESTQTPIEMAGTAVLAILACCIQGKYIVEAKPNWIEPTNLFALIVAEPGERKSAVVKQMIRPIEDYEKIFNRDHADELFNAKAKLKILLTKQKNIEKLMLNGKHEAESEYSQILREISELEKKRPLKLFFDDITPEALVRILEDNGGIASILSAEGGIFDQLAGGMYSKSVNLDVFLKAHDGDAIRVDRVTRESNAITNPVLTILLAIQTRVLEHLIQNQVFRGRGLTARFLVSCPKTLVGSRRYDTKEIDKLIEQGYHDVITGLLEDHVTDDPVVIHFSEEADACMRAFFEEIETKMQVEYDAFRDWALKIQGAVARISGIICRTEYLIQGDRTPLIVDGYMMQRAIDLGNYYLNQAESVFMMMGTDRSQKKCEYVLKAIKKAGKAEANQRDIMRMCRSFQKVDDLKPVLDMLCEYGYLREKEPSEKTGGRPRSILYEVNPYFMEKI